MKIYTHFVQRILPFGLLMTLCIASLSGCQTQGNHADTETDTKAVNLAFEEFTNDLFLEEVVANTINLHYSVENPAALGIEEYEITLGDFSEEARDASDTYLLETKNALSQFSYAQLSLENQLTYDVLMDFLNTQIALCDYDLYEEPFSFSGGLQMELPILFAEYEFQSEQDVKDYLKLIALTDEYFDQAMMLEAEKSDKGLFMSEDLCELVIDSCESFLLNRENHYLITTFESRLKELDFSEQKVASYCRQNETILEKQLFPAYEDMIIQLEKLKQTGKNENGICYLKDGKKYYETLVYSETGCADRVDVIFQRIENQRMNDLLVCTQLQKCNENLIQECSSLEWQMANPTTMLTRLQSAILNDFPAPPDCSYEINYVEPALEEFLAPAFYIVAPIDNYTENVIYINEGYIASDIYAFTTLAHEGYPGHLYQTVMTYSYSFPHIRTILSYGGYVEGWATYIEMMAYGYAGLDEDVASFLSHNQAATLSLYASSDIGLHYYGWTPEEMKEFWAGYGITNEVVINEITQLILSEPGNYLKYYVGYLEFLELKEYAKDLFGSGYSEKQFHKAILDIGPAPFAILEEYLPKYYSPQT
ncbi:MAG: DUF885 domain-containing protein [Agathobacter sp.]|nr:DUF885 domain-containing protein [Agathobacter sp.]